MLRRGLTRLTAALHERRTRWTAAATIASALMYAAAFPPLAWNGIAWVALVPWFLVMLAQAPRTAFRAGFFGGWLFWGLTLSWLAYFTPEGVGSDAAIAWLKLLTIIAWIALSAYCALYGAVFLWLGASLRQGLGVDRFGSILLYIVTLPVAWAGLDYLRAHLFSGFTWNMPAISQFDCLPVIQVASIGGVYLVSAVIILVNVAIALALDAAWRRQPLARVATALALAALAAGAAFGYGATVLARPPGEHTTITVVAIQPNIPQGSKADADHKDPTLFRLHDLSTAGVRDAAARAGGVPDLLVWPETAVPTCLRDDRAGMAVVYDLLTNGVPLLAGCIDRSGDMPPEIYNSAILFGVDGRVKAAYNKRHLVPFGEVVPFEDALPFIRTLAPLPTSLTPGRESTVFSLADGRVRFSSLICFEDTMPRLARAAVRAGARMLVNQTNDGWFQESIAARQHMTHCVLRCVEHRVPAVRAANNGITCAIGASGAVTDLLADAPDGSRATGWLVCDVAVPAPSAPPTLYTRTGDVFALLGVALAVGGAAAFLIRGRPLRQVLMSREGVC